jgi:hypothetical protein
MVNEQGDCRLRQVSETNVLGSYAILLICFLAAMKC